MSKAKKRGFHPTFEVLEGRRLLSSLPFDDSGLAPAGLAATCALPNLPVYDVKSYGATGNGVTDDTVAIRNALAAAEAAGGGIIYLPAGIYDVCPQQSDLTNLEYYWNSTYGGNLPIFVITTSNIVFIGDGAGTTHLEGYSLGMKDPVTNWYSATPGGAVCRFDMFMVDASVAMSTIQFRSLDICGNAGWTPEGASGGWPANPVTGDGWDITNKCICMLGATIDNVLVFNCDLHAFRGEIVYAGGNDPGQISIINSDLYSSNGDAVSCSADMLLSHDTIGGDTPGSDVYNGVENFDLGAPEKTVIEDCSISCSSNAADPHGYGVAYLGLPTSSLTVEGTTFSNCSSGILFSEFGYHVMIHDNTFSNCTYAMITAMQWLYPQYFAYEGFSDFTISDNRFNNCYYGFFSQAYNNGANPPFTNFVLDDNTVTNGALLGGSYWSVTPDAWTGFVVSGNFLGTGATDMGSYDGGNNVALWANTMRASSRTATDIIADFSSETTTTVGSITDGIGLLPYSDQTVLDYNENPGGTQYIEFNTGLLGNYPTGFQTEFVNGPNSPDNWVLEADPSWNTFSSNQPVGANGLWVQFNAQGLFTLMPVLSGIESTSLAYTDNEPATAITSTLAASDEDSSPTLAGATLSISGNYQSGEDVLSFSNTPSITGSWNAATGTLTLTGSDTLADYQTALRSVTYLDTSDNPNTATRTVSFQINDGQAESNVVSRQITVSSAPVLAGIESGPLAYTGGEPATAVTAAITASDADSPTLAGATVWISGSYRNGEDILSFTNTATITGNWDAATGTLTLTGSDTLADYQAALRSVTYVDTSSNPSSATRIVSFQVTDGPADSNLVTRQITVTPASQSPLLAGIESGPLAYTEGAPATAVTAAITVADGESVSLAGATVWISGNYQSGEDLLTFANTANITGSWDAATGTLTLTGIDSLADYQAALRSVTYDDTSSNPSSATRTVSFQANDCLADSNVVTRQITITKPLSLGPTSLPADTEHVAYNETLTASGGTGTTTLTVSNIQNAVAGLVVPASGSNSLNVTGIPTAAGTETFTVTATDSPGASTSTNYSITVNWPPALAGIETVPLDYTAEAPAESLTSALTVSDVESTTLIGATVWISGNYQSGEDVLSFANTANITGSWNAATGTLTLTGTDTLADYQAALQAVDYQDTSAGPNIAVRTVSFEISDGTANSNVETRQIIRIVPLSSPPMLSDMEPNSLEYALTDGATPITSAFSVSDLESTTLIGATVWISGNYQSGEDVLSFVNTANITGSWNAATGCLTLSGTDTPADYQAALCSVNYQDTSADPSGLTRTISFQVSDGLANSNVASRQIAVTPVATWAGSASGDLSDPTQWVGGAAPNPAVDDLIFGSTIASSPFNDFPAGTSFSDLILDGNTALSGNSVVLDSTIVNAQGNNRVSLPLALGDDGLFEVLSGSLVVGGSIDNGGNMLEVSSAVSTKATLGGPISGAGGLVESGAASLLLTGQNSYSGGTTILAGTLQAASEDAIPSGTALSVGSGSALLFSPGAGQSSVQAGPAVLAAGKAQDSASPGVSTSAVLPASRVAPPVAQADSGLNIEESNGLNQAALVLGPSVRPVMIPPPCWLQTDTRSWPVMRVFSIGVNPIPDAAPAPKAKGFGGAWAVFAPPPLDSTPKQNITLTPALVDLVLSQQNV